MSHEDDTIGNGMDSSKKEKESEKEDDLLKSEKYRKGLRNPHQAYIRDTKYYKLLSEEERSEVFRRYRDHGEKEMRDLLITSNLRLVLKIARENSKHTNLPLIDLIQEGNIGLIWAIDKYDPDRGVKFSYYAAFWIRAYIMKYIMDNWSSVKVITSEKKRRMFYRLNKEKERLAKLGLDATAEKLAESLKVETEDILEMERILYEKDISLDRPLSSENNSESLVDLRSSKMDTEKIISDNDLKRKGRALFDSFRKTLSPKELVIFDNRICCEKAMTLHKIGEMIGLSREKVRQMQVEIYNKLHKFKEREESAALQKASELTGVTLSEVKAVTRKDSVSREVALLHFGLNGDGVRSSNQDIATQTGLPKSSVPTIIGRVKQRIRNRR